MKTTLASPATADDAPANHEPVLVAAFLTLGLPVPLHTFIDATFGLGGHTAAVLAHRPEVTTVLGLDRDAAMLAAAIADPRVRKLHLPASAMVEGLRQIGAPNADAILLDLGLNSRQLATAERGFSFARPGPLDMRFDPSRTPQTAADWLRTTPEAELVRILFEYGEERFARRIAHAIVEQRARCPLTTTTALADLVSRAIPRSAHPARIHPATRTFMALRIAVNDELNELRAALSSAIACLRPGGRLSVISFHSLEDRLVKQRFAEASTVCRCPPTFPVCRCDQRATVRLVTRHPVVADATEVAANPRSRSAKLRVIERLPATASAPETRR